MPFLAYIALSSCTSCEHFTIQIGITYTGGDGKGLYTVKKMYMREMDVAARVSHPNLLRFLGARLEGGMAILTEFMPTSLRAL